MKNFKKSSADTAPADNPTVPMPTAPPIDEANSSRSKGQPTSGSSGTGSDKTAPGSPATSTGSSKAAGSGTDTTSGMRKPDNGRGGAFILPMIAILVVLGLLATFIIQNTQSIVINFLGWTGSAPLSATLLIAVAVGILLVTLFGAVRIMQLRRRVRKAAKS